MRSPQPRSRKSSSTGRLSSMFEEPPRKKQKDRRSTVEQPVARRFDPWGGLKGRVTTLPMLSGPAGEQTSTATPAPATANTHGPSIAEGGVINVKEVTTTTRAAGTQPRSVRLAHFVSKWAQRALQAWLAREEGPAAVVCEECQVAVVIEKSSFDHRAVAVSEQAYRCVDCFLPRILCKLCSITAHMRDPLHRQEVWDHEQGFWSRVSLGDLGLVLNLGHSGQKCVIAPKDARRMTIVHSHGVVDIGVRFCACLNQELEGTPHAVQLIEHGLWPGSWEKPLTVFTIEVLKDFHLLSLQSQMTALDFYRYLQRRTDNIEMDLVADRYRELLFAMQEFIWLRSAKRAGLDPVRNMRAGSLAVLCPSCPQLGVNMDSRWRARPMHMRYLDALYTTMDGNFQQNQRQKPSDPGDFALSEGAAYFANTHDFKIYQEHLGPLEREPSTCHKFGAMGYGGYGGRVSGTVGLSCARHMFVLPGGGVDLEKGERFANVDFAMISGLQRWMQIFLVISGYDINCQYRKNFNKRMQWFEENGRYLTSIQHVRFPKTLSVIGKFHLPAHTASCRYKFSYYWMPGAGMTDGEAPERIWSVLNGLAARTREMAAGHRHDIINDHHSDMNVRRVHTMARSLTVKHDEALKQSALISDELQRLEAKLPSDKLKEWKRIEADYLRKVVDLATHEGLDNPYEMHKDAALSQKQISALLTESVSKVERAERRGLVGVLEEGIELQELRLEILEHLKEDEDGEGDRLNDILQGKIERFHARLDLWQKLRSAFLAPLLAASWREVSANLDEGGGEGEDLQMNGIAFTDSVEAVAAGTTRSEELEILDSLIIELPSSLSREMVRCSCLKDAVEVELRLREGQANDALAEVRVHLITKFTLKHQQRDIASQVPMTRSRQHLKRQGEAVERAGSTYRRARLCMLRLVAKPEDCVYRELKSSDMVAFTLRDEDQILGESRKASSWIWEDSSWLENASDEKVKVHISDALRVHWFRRSALNARWREQKLLLEEEMRRTARFFQHWAEVWATTSDEAESRGRRREASYGRRQASRYRRLLDGASKQFEGRIDVMDALEHTDGQVPQKMRL
ncbi:hypothetical protein CERSUDRAFT_118810 [Gelatoporia subvermispora B]|uniref:CxC2-like cysteine cluster KDZ transposase-associated domain-containing protein n=1 Tax=Ceriporiopsis subvermispora (strain B) TaxID=914234 RepID=M2PAF9_CERS8|nr:hypothetical protein CERSUDRAFT_118810 [Gelatoporia subvermispora B]